VSVFPHLADVRYGDPLLAHFVVNLATAADPTFFAAGFRSVLRQIEQMSGGPLLLSNEGLSGSLWDGGETGLRNAERLHGLLPAARILIAVRRQDEMLRSIHAQYVNEGGTRPLRAFIDGRGVAGSRFSLRHLEYDRLVGRYVDLFGRDRVWVVPYEYLRAWPDRFLDRLCEMLGTRLTAPVSHAWLNHSLSRPALWLLRSWNGLFRLSCFNPDPRLAPLPGGRHARNIMQRHVDPMLRRLGWKTGSGEDARMLADLAGQFARSNERLQQFCEEPLADWGYVFPPA
jgi:Sulfotransferase family